MYKLLLCVRYLRTRYLAFVCIVSVMLGVATLIVVNSVMSGFSTKLKERLHGILSDVIVETERSNGFDESPAEVMAKLKATEAGPSIAAMAPTVEVFALLQFNLKDRYGRPVPVTKHVRMIGIDAEQQAQVGRFAQYLHRQKGSLHPSFALTPEALDRFTRNRLAADPDAAFRIPLEGTPPGQPQPGSFLNEPNITIPASPPVVVPPPDLAAPQTPRLPGVILGYSIAHTRWKDPETGEATEYALLKPGDDVMLATVGSGGFKPVYSTFVVTDYFQSEMSEYDGSFVYVPLDELQRLRGMDGKCNSIQVKLTDDVRDNPMFVNNVIVPQLAKAFHPTEARVASWQQHQGPLLAAIDIERGILNLLLFMIVGVAGFSVLAIFTMIVSEKYRDIGILKSLGASNRGILAIFIGYGLLLGVIGCLLGTGLGLAITEYINEIEAGLTAITGQQVFDRSVYYFDRIPTNIDPMTVLLVNVGAAGIAVLFSVLPALRAARLHPVRALRFE
ncbi:MAG: FtsX-like permease family protein [Bacteroidales bacterium]|nr:FtsX-like permease family protein [Bacteroidales bacterium]